MILTVTLNAALDVTYHVDRLVQNTTHRVERVTRRAGGKGINVAQVLRTLGEDVVVTGLAGGDTGTAIRTDLARRGLTDELVPTAAESRGTLAVVADGDATGFYEPGPQVTDAEWRTFLARYDELVAAATVVALSGSLPPTVPVDGYATLVGRAHAAGCATIVDADGDALRAALTARPGLVTPNRDELFGATGVHDPPAAAALLRAEGAAAVAATLGADGMLLVTEEDSWRARLTDAVAGNPTGAGDACVAALAAGEARETPWRGRLRDAVALSAAAVATPVAGEVDLARYTRNREAVSVEVTSAAHRDR